MTTLLNRAALLGLLAFASLPACALEPFVATYQAYYKGKLAGNAKMQVVQAGTEKWRVDLGIRGNRGFAHQCPSLYPFGGRYRDGRHL